jgi:hypothetical protein
VVKHTVIDDGISIYVMGENAGKSGAIKPWVLAEINFEKGQFVHTNRRNFFTRTVRKNNTSMRRDWNGWAGIQLMIIVKFRNLTYLISNMNKLSETQSSEL